LFCKKSFTILILSVFFQTLWFCTGCEKLVRISKEQKEEKEVTFLFLYTNDEHGHFYEKEGFYKAAVLYEMWHEEEENCKGCKIFRLSGGDNYTGFSGSSFFSGNSMAEIMNILGYQISAVGNHEFDFGMQPFMRNRILSKTKYLSSNIIFSDHKKTFDASVTIESLDGDVAFVGATTEDLKQVSFANYILDAKVVKPEGPVGRELKKLKETADVLTVIAHDSYESSLMWASSLDTKPLIVFTAHSHEEIIKNHNGVLFVQSGRNLNNYVRVEVVKKGDRIQITKADIIPLRKNTLLDLEKTKLIKSLTDKFLATIDKKAGMELIKTDTDFENDSFQKLYACSMLDAYPEYDVAMSNPGGFRDSLKKGVVKKSDIISILPFNNRIVLAKVSGRDLIHNLELSENSYCGVKKTDEGWIRKGERIVPDQTYRVVIHEYILGGGDYFKFMEYKSESEITSKDWRVPIEKYLFESSKKGLDIHQALDSLKAKYDH
jgi:5'-nucleotidase / UDP-sugar diphosphatase